MGSTALHATWCRGGVGRAGLIAACLLLHLQEANNGKVRHKATQVYACMFLICDNATFYWQICTQYCSLQRTVCKFVSKQHSFTKQLADNAGTSLSANSGMSQTDLHLLTVAIRNVNVRQQQVNCVPPYHTVLCTYCSCTFAGPAMPRLCFARTPVNVWHAHAQGAPILGQQRKLPARFITLCCL